MLAVTATGTNGLPSHRSKAQVAALTASREGGRSCSPAAVVEAITGPLPPPPRLHGHGRDERAWRGPVVRAPPSVSGCRASCRSGSGCSGDPRARRGEWDHRSLCVRAGILGRSRMLAVTATRTNGLPSHRSEAWVAALTASREGGDALVPAAVTVAIAGPPHPPVPTPTATAGGAAHGEDRWCGSHHQ